MTFNMIARGVFLFTFLFSFQLDGVYKVVEKIISICIWKEPDVMCLKPKVHEE